MHQLTQVVKWTQSGGSVTVGTYSYDGAGARARVKDGATYTNSFYYLGHDPIYSHLDRELYCYVYVNGRLRADINGNSEDFYFSDVLGGVRSIYQDGGLKFKVQSYKPFGGAWGVTDYFPGIYKQRFKFAGEMTDSTGIYYLSARYYDPDIGRFLSLDPKLGKLSMPQTLNRYVYCMNNPLGFIDPTGMILETLFDIGSIIWDIGELINNLNWENIGLLLLDIGCAFVPFLPALGPGIRAAKIIDKVADKGEDFSRFFKWSDDLEFVNVAKREGLFDNTFLKNSARKVEFPNGAYFVNYGPRKMHPNFVTDLISKDLDKVENLLVWNRNQLSKGLNLYYIPPGKIGWIGKTGPMMDFPGLRGGAAQIWFPEAGGIVLVEHFPNWFIL